MEGAAASALVASFEPLPFAGDGVRLRVGEQKTFGCDRVRQGALMSRDELRLRKLVCPSVSDFGKP